MNYTTLLFDAFDTVIHINESKLPTCDTGGKAVPTTAPAVHSAYCNIFGKKEFDVFYDAFSQSHRQVRARRRIDLKEIVSQERFRIMLSLLEHPSGEITDEVIEALTTPHMHLLEESFEVRPDVVKALNWMHIRPSEALFFGDQLYIDVYGALRAGMDVVWVETEPQDWIPPEVEVLKCKPTYTVRRLSDVIELLEVP